MTEWLATLGIGAFLFFTIKGLAWLIVPALIIWYKRRKAQRANMPGHTLEEAQ